MNNQFMNNKLQKLLFELSSEERIKIVYELEKSNLKLTHLSRKLDLTTTEISRHLQRLCERMLIQKDANGYFTLTQYGKLTLHLLENLSFVSTNYKYFLEYDVSGIPYQFIDRIGEISDCKYDDEALLNLQVGEKKIKEASEYVWILSDQVLASTIEPLAEKTKTQFDLRIILPNGKFPPENESRLPKTRNRIQKRGLPNVKVLLVLTENYAVFCLPNHTGRIDYTGFTGDSSKFHKWCKDLFLYYWDKSTDYTGETAQAKQNIALNKPLVDTCTT